MNQMQWQWLVQLAPELRRCRKCGGMIDKWRLYYRWCFNPDGLDEHGVDFCAPCRSAMGPERPNL